MLLQSYDEKGFLDNYVRTEMGISELKVSKSEYKRNCHIIIQNYMYMWHFLFFFFFFDETFFSQFKIYMYK